MNLSFLDCSYCQIKKIYIVNFVDGKIYIYNGKTTLIVMQDLEFGNLVI